MEPGNWVPATDSQAMTPTEDLLQTFIHYASDEQFQQLDKLLSADEKQRYSALMTLDKQQWFTAVESLDDCQIELLMQFFTAAERLPGWEAGAESPVIWLGKVLKQRGTGINRELVQWIKANSDNRFLPHGALL